jgi:hypothetical protein
MHFDFILFLALCPVKDLHVKLGRTTMVIEEHKKALMQVMILCKLGPVAPEEHLTTAIIIYFHLVWSASTRFFMKDGFIELAPVHELSKLRRNTLLLTALSTSDNVKREQIDRRRRRSIVLRSMCIHKLLGRRRRRLWLILTP